VLFRLLIFLGMLLCRAAVAGDVEEQAVRLASLRAEVDSLSSALEMEKDDLRSRLRAVEAQKVDLEVQIRREELRMERLIAEEVSRMALLEQDGVEDDLTPAVKEGIALLHGTVTAGLPYQRPARLSALADLETRLSDSTLSPEQVAARLWAFAEDERRLTRENALSRQVLALADGEVLADVARLGMVAMYYRTPDGGYGQAVQRGSDWQLEPVSDAAEVEQLAALFDALTRGIHVGWFTLPRPLPGAAQ
jgi:hypothetical protein